MKIIYITNRKGLTREVFVDDEDYDWIVKNKWYINVKGYAVRNSPKINGKKKTIYMHVEIMGNPIGVLVDHKKRNTLDNRKDELRIATRKQNLMNSKGYGVSKFLGVSKHARKKKIKDAEGNIIKIYYAPVKWRAYIIIDKKQKNIGHYDTEIEAAKAYDSWAIIHHGEFANLNFPEDYPGHHKNTTL